jgi:undecaprenyl diphosphate synthase
MELLAHHLRAETQQCIEEGVRISLIGRRDRLPEPVVAAANYAESATRRGSTLHLRLAIDYSAREAILSAARTANEATRETFSRAIGEDVDLLIRTGGEQRLSDFLLWECAYAELVFTPRMWPDFDAGDLEAAVDEFQSRERRFGCVTLGQSWIQNANGTVPDLRRDRWLR